MSTSTSEKCETNVDIRFNNFLLFFTLSNSNLNCTPTPNALISSTVLPPSSITLYIFLFLQSLTLPFLPVAPQSNGDAWEAQNHEPKENDMGPLTDTERRDLNRAVKEYLLFIGYRLTTMTFYEEVPLSPTLFILHFLIILSLQPIAFIMFVNIFSKLFTKN